RSRFDDAHLLRGGLRHPHHFVVREVLFHDAALGDGDLPVKCRAQTEDGAAPYLRGEGGGIDDLARIAGRIKLVHAHPPPRVDRDLGDLSDDRSKRLPYGNATGAAWRRGNSPTRHSSNALEHRLVPRSGTQVRTTELERILAGG